jgi:hypothetical protein
MKQPAYPGCTGREKERLYLLLSENPKREHTSDIFFEKNISSPEKCGY